jgi:hypothetical protein
MVFSILICCLLFIYLLLIAENSTIVSHLYLESVTRREEGEYTCHPSMLGKPPGVHLFFEWDVEIPVC